LYGLNVRDLTSYLAWQSEPLLCLVKCVTGYGYTEPQRVALLACNVVLTAAFCLVSALGFAYEECLTNGCMIARLYVGNGMLVAHL